MAKRAELPDPKVQRWVHPLDVPEARPLFRKSWLAASLGSVPVGLCVAAIVAFAIRGYVAPMIAAAAIIGSGIVSSRFYRRQAWAFIPRKRQDRGRPLPLAWELWPSAAFAVVLALALLLVTLRLDQPDVSLDVREFVFGVGGAVGVLLLAGAVAGLAWGRRGARRRALLRTPTVAAVLASLAVAYGVLFGSSGPATWDTVLWGAVAVLLVGVGVGVVRYVTKRREVRNPLASGDEAL